MAGMLIFVTHPDPAEALQWVCSLQAALPDARVLLDDAGRGEPAPQADELTCAVGWKPPADFFERHPGLAAFFCAGAGVDHLLRHPGLHAELPLVRLEDAGMGPLMADYCLRAVLHIAGQGHRFAQQQTQAQWIPHAPLARVSLPVGIVGLGVLGRQVATRLREAGFPVCGYVRSARAQARTHGGANEFEVFHGEAGWKPFLARSRILILLAPLTAETENMIDAQALSHLPPGAWLINVARGGLVVDTDLILALDQGALEGAILDVFRVEPLPAAHPFWHHPRVTVTPHVSAPTQIECSTRQVAANIRRLARGEPLTGVVDRARGY
jgi:glyoxylate/hydroxypyruvate reductase A